MFSLLRILFYGSQEKRSAAGENHQIRFAQRSYELYRQSHYLYRAICIVIGGLCSIGWVSSNVSTESRQGRFDGLNLLMASDTDTIKIVMPPLDFGNEMESWSAHYCGFYEDEFENKKGWLLEPYEPEPMNLDQIMAQIAYPPKLKQLAICANIRFRILIDRDGQYIRHEALRGDSLALAAVEPLLSQLKFLPNPLGFDVSPRWVELGLQLPYTPPTFIPDINTFLYCDREPKVLNIKEAISKHSYPASCRNLCYEGSTIIRVLVSEKGKYLDHRVITSVHPILAKYWSLVVKDLAFSPAQYQGEDIAFWVNIPFDFKLIN